MKDEQKNEIKEEVKSFVNEEAMLDVLRDNNMTTIDSMCELIDNSWDANAKNIWIDFDVDPSTKKIWMLVQDDGDGIDKVNIKRALSLGGTMNARISPKIGRFGMGLSNACASQSPRSILASRTSGDGKLWANEIDFDYLKNNKAIFPETYELKDKFVLSRIKFEKSGTVIYWPFSDNLDYKRTSNLHASLMEVISRTYRYFLNMGRNVYINGKVVELFDPLCRLENHRASKDYGMEKLYCDPIVIPVKYQNDKGVEEVSNVVVELVLLDYNKVLDKPELESKLQIGMRMQGFYLIRNGREINIPEWYGIRTQKIDHQNYMRGEIKFDSKLDKAFGIGHNKSRAYPKEELLEDLRKEVGPKALAAFNDHMRRRKQRAEEKKAGGSEAAKKIHESVMGKIVPDEKMVIVENVEKKRPKTIEEVKQDLAKKIETDPTISDKTKENRKKLLDNMFASKYSMEIIISSDGAGNPLFRIEEAQGKKIIMVNGDHKFYEHVYEPATENPYSHALLDMALYTLADVRDGLGDDTLKEMFDQIMVRFSRRYGAMFNQKDFAEVLLYLSNPPPE